MGKVLEFRHKNCKELIPTSQLNAVVSLCKLYDALATPENGVCSSYLYCSVVIRCNFLLKVNPDDVDNYPRMIEMWFLFSLIWSICASVDEDSRKKIDTLLREMESQFPAKVSNMKLHHMHICGCTGYCL